MKQFFLYFILFIIFMLNRVHLFLFYWRLIKIKIIIKCFLVIFYSVNFFDYNIFFCHVFELIWVLWTLLLYLLIMKYISKFNVLLALRYLIVFSQSLYLRDVGKLVGMFRIIKMINKRSVKYAVVFLFEPLK